MARVPSAEDQYLTPNSCWGGRSFFSAMGASPAPCFILKYENHQDRFGAKAMAAARILIVEDERLIAIDLQKALDAARINSRGPGCLWDRGGPESADPAP
jgi:hypothetical protein